MAQVRQTTVAAAHAKLGDATLAWTADEQESALKDYVVKHGVAHLLWSERNDQAEARMLDLHFMAAFADSWPTVVEPLAAWRIVGLERAREGFAEVANELPAVEKGTEALADVCDEVSSFLRIAGLYDAALPLASWSLNIFERTFGVEHANTIIAVHNLALLFEHLGRYDRAESLAVKCLEIRRRTLATEHPSTLSSLALLGFIYESQGHMTSQNPFCSVPRGTDSYAR